MTSFITGSKYRAGTRRLIARYDTRTGAVNATRSYAAVDGYEFVATPTRFVVFGNGHWTARRIDGGPLRQVAAPGPGPRPPAAAKIEPDEPGGSYVSASTTTCDGRAVVLRVIGYANRADTNEYSAYEAIDVDIAHARVLRRTRYADDTGGPRPRPYVFDIRNS